MLENRVIMLEKNCLRQQMWKYGSETDGEYNWKNEKSWKKFWKKFVLN